MCCAVIWAILKPACCSPLALTGQLTGSYFTSSIFLETLVQQTSENVSRFWNTTPSPPGTNNHATSNSFSSHQVNPMQQVTVVWLAEFSKQANGVPNKVDSYGLLWKKGETCGAAGGRVLRLSSASLDFLGTFVLLMQVMNIALSSVIWQ